MTNELEKWYFDGRCFLLERGLVHGDTRKSTMIHRVWLRLIDGEYNAVKDTL